MGPAAAGIIEVDTLVPLMLRELRGVDENSVRNISGLLAPYPPADAVRALTQVVGDPVIVSLAGKVIGYLEQLRHLQNTKQANQMAAVYESVLPGFNPDRPAYRPDQAQEIEDKLGVKVYAGHLAQLIAAKSTELPLSIGLFGAWGSGKSHFVDLMDEHIRTPSKPNTPYYQNIVQIRFNAWHYLDTNLWANLVCEIFDQLFAKLTVPNDEVAAARLQNLREQLTSQGALTQEAQQAVQMAEAARTKAEVSLVEARRERKAQEKTVGAMVEDMGNLVRQCADQKIVQEQLHNVARTLGLPELERSYSDLEARVLEARTLGGHTKVLILSILNRPGSWWARAALMIVALALPLGVQALEKGHWPLAYEFFQGAGRIVSQLAAVLVGLSSWLALQVRKGNGIVGGLEKAYQQVKAAREKSQASDATAQARAGLIAKQQAEESAKQSLREAEAKILSIKAEIAEMAPGRQLMRFLKNRASADDYRRHLGLVIGQRHSKRLRTIE